MQIDRLRTMLDAPAEAETLAAAAWASPTPHAGHANLVRLADRGRAARSARHALRAVRRRGAAAGRSRHGAQQPGALRRSPPAARWPPAALFERDPRGAAARCCRSFQRSQNLSDLLVQRPRELRPAADDRAASRSPATCWSRSWSPTCARSSSEDEVMAALRRFKRRETLRIAYGDIVHGQLGRHGHAADFLRGRRDRRSGASTSRRGRSARSSRPPQRPRRRAAAGSSCWPWASSAARELNYSSDIDLVFLYDQDGQTDAPPHRQQRSEFFERLAREVIQLLTEPTDLGFAYRVDMRLRPDGRAGAAVHAASISALALLRHAAAAPGSGRRTSRPGRSPATSSWAGSSSHQLRAVDLSPLPEPGRHHRHQGASSGASSSTPRTRGVADRAT